MEIKEIRRARLRLWFSERSIPESEKSYLSQLMGGKASFGERAARRLERDYGMGDKYLDQTDEKGEVDAPARTDSGQASVDEVLELITLHRNASARERKMIMTTARAVNRRGNSLLADGAGD